MDALYQSSYSSTYGEKSRRVFAGLHTMRTWDRTKENSLKRNTTPSGSWRLGGRSHPPRIASHHTDLQNAPLGHHTSISVRPSAIFPAQVCRATVGHPPLALPLQDPAGCNSLKPSHLQQVSKSKALNNLEPVVHQTKSRSGVRRNSRARFWSPRKNGIK